MIPSTRDFVLYIGATFGPYTYAFNSTPSRDVGDFTADPTTDKILLSGHGLSLNDQIRFKSTGVLPAPLLENQLYYVVSPTTNDFKVALTAGGGAIDITDAGGPSSPDSGAPVHSVIKRGTPLDLTGWSFWSWVKTDVGDSDSNLLLDLAPTVVGSASNGLVQILKSVAQTHDLNPYDNGVHSFLGRKPTGERLVFTLGKFDLKQISTHPA